MESNVWDQGPQWIVLGRGEIDALIYGVFAFTHLMFPFRM